MKAIEAEIRYSIIHQEGWGLPSVEDQYVVIPAPGTTDEENFELAGCGFHYWDSEYGTTGTYVTWPESHTEKECFTDRPVEYRWQSAQVIATHEWAESATDPVSPPNEYYDLGWDGQNGAAENENEEIGDVCLEMPGAWHEVEAGIWVQKLWDNYLNAESQPTALASQLALELSSHLGVRTD